MIGLVLQQRWAPFATSAESQTQLPQEPLSLLLLLLLVEVVLLLPA
jgi:hypothetical protein